MPFVEVNVSVRDCCAPDALSAMLFSTSLSSPLPRFFGTGVARAEVQSEQTAAQAESARTWRENAERGVYIAEVYRARSRASRLSATQSARMLLSLSDLPARPAITDTTGKPAHERSRTSTGFPIRS